MEKYDERFNVALKKLENNETIVALLNIELTPYSIGMLALTTSGIRAVAILRDHESNQLEGDPRTKEITSNENDQKLYANFINELKSISDSMLIDSKAEVANVQKTKG